MPSHFSLICHLNHFNLHLMYLIKCIKTTSQLSQISFFLVFLMWSHCGYLLQMVWSEQKIFKGFGEYATSFNPTPLPLISLIAMAVKWGLRCWESGTYKSVSFMDNDFAKVYRQHSNSLAQFKVKQLVNLQKLCCTLCEDAWYVVCF